MKVPSGVEQRLVKRLQDGEKTAAREFYTLYADYLAGICSRYIADEDDLKDAFQDAFIHILTNIADFQYRGEGSLKSWAAKVTVNQSLKFLRTKGKLQQVHQAIEVPDETEEDDQPQTEVETTSPPTPLPWARGDKKIAGTETETKTGTITGKGTTLPSGALTETETKTKTKKLAKTESETDVPAESVGVTEAEEVTENTETIVPDEPVKPHETEKKVEPSVNRSRVIYPTEIRQSKMPENRLMAKVYMSNVVVNNRKATDGSHSIDYNPGSNIPDSVRTHYRSKFKGKANYRQPIRVGVSLRYMLNNRWSLESGLTYTHLASDIGTETLRNNLIGLPLNVGYQVWNNRHFGLYVSAGGTIEKMLEEKPWQFSVNAALGAEYKFSKRLSLFAEPGIGYYFPNDSDIPIIYQDHPLNFNLNFGLRINIK